MPATATSYPAKVLLFGEHVVLRGGTGLAVPFPRFALRWQRNRPDERLLALCDYLKVAIPRDLLDSGRLEDELLDDLRLVGDIPEGYGLGSSGAVCAAVWDAFATERGKQCSLQQQREWLARMEQHYHGTSSGLDPLISYRQQPLRIGGPAPEIVRPPADALDGFFLVDTGPRRRPAGELITTFTERYDDDHLFRGDAELYWAHQSRRCIDALLRDDREELYTAFSLISQFQLDQLPDFIPPEYQVGWDGGDGYRMKICGAGGGGMLLGLARDRAAVAATFGEGVYWLQAYG